MIRGSYVFICYKKITYRVSFLSVKLIPLRLSRHSYIILYTQHGILTQFLSNPRVSPFRTIKSPPSFPSLF